MGQIAASWGQGKIDAVAVSKKARVEAAKASSKRRWVECQECKQSGPHGGFGLCLKCYKRFKATENVGICSICDPALPVGLRKLDPPICYACHARERRRLERERDPEMVKIKQNQYARKQRLRPERRARDSEITRNYYERHPEMYARKLERQRARYQERKAGVPAPPRKYVRSPKPEARKPRYAPVPGRMRPTDAPLLPPDTFADALAFLRTESRPDKIYRRRPAA